MNKTLVAKAVSKALQSTCNYRISAIGLNSKGDCVGTAINKHNLVRYGGSKHAEIELIKKYGKAIRTIIICRVGRNGKILPIDCCPTCQKTLDRLNIKILTIKE